MQGLTYNDRLMISSRNGPDAGRQLSENGSVKGVTEGGVDHALRVESLGQRASLNEEVRRPLIVSGSAIIHWPHAHVGLADPVPRHCLIQVGFFCPEISLGVACWTAGLRGCGATAA